MADSLDATPGAWPSRQLALAGEAGVFGWFVPRSLGGQGWTESQILAAYLELSQACLTTCFTLTQLTGAIRRISKSENGALAESLLPDLTLGKTLATVGISHLTTSRQHLTQPALRATPIQEGYCLQGLSPWVTGAAHVDRLVTGATLEDGRQILAVVPSDSAGVQVQPPAPLVGLNASCTGAVTFNDVVVPADAILSGPVENVMQSGAGARTGGLQTSTLALGLARAALRFVTAEAKKRGELQAVVTPLLQEWQAAADTLAELTSASGDADAAQRASDLRAHSNSLVLRATQTALGAAKGAGYVAGHPVGRWCREALFFLVWSCPQAVVTANLCEFAGLGTDGDPPALSNIGMRHGS